MHNYNVFENFQKVCCDQSFSSLKSSHISLLFQPPNFVFSPLFQKQMNRQTNKTKYRNTHIQTHKPKPKKKNYRTRNHGSIQEKDKKENICQNKTLLDKCWTFTDRN